VIFEVNMIFFTIIDIETVIIIQEPSRSHEQDVCILTMLS
jgi:hypothetical protein